jgi:hypothetical protein
MKNNTVVTIKHPVQNHRNVLIQLILSQLDIYCSLTITSIFVCLPADDEDKQLLGWIMRQIQTVIRAAGLEDRKLLLYINKNNNKRNSREDN